MANNDKGMVLPKWAEEAIDSIDAGFFSSDSFHSKEAVEYLSKIMSSWSLELINIRSQLDADQETDEKQDLDTGVRIEVKLKDLETLKGSLEKAQAPSVTYSDDIERMRFQRDAIRQAELTCCLLWVSDVLHQ